MPAIPDSGKEHLTYEIEMDKSCQKCILVQLIKFQLRFSEKVRRVTLIECVTEIICSALLKKQKSQQRRRQSRCRDKEKSIGAILKPPNYCRLKLKAFPIMPSLGYLVLPNLANRE